ncbi:MAG: class I SAM-dependent methyltransferase [Streptosporangiaceae bacterium]
MSLGKLARDTVSTLSYRATWGGSQNFLGARWVERVVDGVPESARERTALRFLALSPHYFYDRDLAAEADRNRRSRQILADAIVLPHLAPDDRVLDYGCGPGYLAAAVAAKAAHVAAVDISRGVLACARVLNGRPNIIYQTPEQFRSGGHQVDLAYSFAVVQHLRTAVLEQMIAVLAAAVRPGGTLLLHFAMAENGYRTEADWLADASLAGRVRLRYGLNCFARSAAEMTDRVTCADFTDAAVRQLSNAIAIPGDDIPDQYLLTARRC